MAFSSSACLLALLISILGAATAAVSPARVSVLENTDSGYLAFAIDDSYNLYYFTSSDGNTWTMGKQMNSASGTIVSNPVAVTMFDPLQKAYVVYVFAQGSNGQVYSYTKSVGSLIFKEQQLSTSLPAMKFTPDVHHIDALKAISHNNLTYIFVRSQTNQSQLFWNIVNSTLVPVSPTWGQIGGGGHLTYDPYPALNTFLGRIEVFATLDDAHVHHIWQTGQTSFKDSWDKLGGLFSPKFNSAPVAEQMSHSDFNGVLNLFVRGEDGVMHQIFQTTCDKVKNPWGPCTWGFFEKLGGTPPSGKDVANPFTVSHNIHLGVEVFVVGDSDGNLYHIWQSERDRKWSDWESLGPLPTGLFVSQPALTIDKFGWWQAYAFDKYPGSLSRYQQKPLTFSVTPKTVNFGQNVTISWSIPVDEATHKDWIGVYPHGAASHQYVDFAYVGGTQNPLADPVPKGSINFTAYLPTGDYSYQYMVNKEYATVLEATAAVDKGTTDLEWEQIYKGIARGLGGINDNITECVEDGNRTIETFRDSFIAFENRHIFEGLHLFAQGLSDIRDALVQCDETVIVEDLTKFIDDLISCTEGSCVKFLIDIADEILILYEHEYEIYGDIQAANNCFKIDAYQQGGFSIGRVTNACLTRM